MWRLSVLALLPLLCRSDPTPCCTTHQFEATLHEVGGYINPVNGVPTPTDFTAQIYYDFDHQMLRSDRSQQNDDGTITTYKVIQDYKHHKQYVINGDQCTASPLTTKMTAPCVPPGSTYMGRRMFGNPGNAVFGDSYHIDLMSTANMTVMVTVSTDDCSPLFESIYGAPGGVVSEVSYFFTNFKKGVPHGVFHIPANCHAHG